MTVRQTVAGFLTAMALASGVSAQATAPKPSISDYKPELNQLQQRGDWPDLERVARQALTSLEAALGPDNPSVASAASWLAMALQGEQRYGEAESLARQALATYEKVDGPQDRSTLTASANLAGLLETEGHFGEAEGLRRGEVDLRLKSLGPENPETAESLINLGELLYREARYAEAEALDRRGLAILEKTRGAADPVTAGCLNNLAAVLRAEGRPQEAEPIMRQTLQIAEHVFGAQDYRTGISMNNLANLLQDMQRFDEAEPLARRALAITEQSLGHDHLETATSVNNLAQLMRHEHRYTEAEPLYQRALGIFERALGPGHPRVAMQLLNLAALLDETGRYSDAEPLLRRALAIAEKTLGPTHPDTAAILSNLGDCLRDQGRYLEAEALIRRAQALVAVSMGQDNPHTAEVRVSLGYTDLLQSKFELAAQSLRPACAVSRRPAQGAAEQNSATVQGESNVRHDCSRLLALSLRGWAARGGGAAPSDRPEALMLEAFTAAQLATQSVAADAMARTAALGAAAMDSVRPEAQAYEDALQEQDAVDGEFARAAAITGDAGVERLRILSSARDQVVERIHQLASELKARAPQYWDYRSPEPLTVAMLQSQGGPDAALLHDDEALIVMLVGPGNLKGLVFALNKHQAAWAQLGMTGKELAAHVTRLRAQIDPQGYGLPAGANVGSSSGSGQPGTGSFDRQAAYELHQALLGDPSIQAVIKDTSVLLFVPTGPLTSLPPGLLVTAPPLGGAAQDADPAGLRATPWLLRSHAVALLPSVSALRTLRQIHPANGAQTPDPLLAFADPDFSHRVVPTATRNAAGPARGLSAYFRDGHALAEALDTLPGLPGTRFEGEALVRALGGGPDSLLTGRRASKAELMARNGDGRLARIRVLEFATHGLVAGDVSELTEPALVLAAGASPDDELLRASEAATLHLNADWVLLSACNTGSPDAPEAQGLSGLARAFFHAGARSLLVSHWEVRDDVPPILIPAMLRAERSDPRLSRAQALRQASLAILDDPRLNAAHPFSWAPFTLIGEAGR